MSKPRKDKPKAKNPAFKRFVPQSTNSPLPLGALKESLGMIMVTGALMGCSFEEKALVATLIPMLLKLMRSVPKGELTVAVDRMMNNSANDSTDPKPESEPKP